MIDTKLIAKQKARLALQYIESAQHMLGKACGELSPIAGMCDEWSLVGKLYDKVHDGWHEVNMRANADDYDLDSDEKAHQLNKIKEKECT